MSALISSIEHSLAVAASDTVKVAKFVETKVLPVLKQAQAEAPTIEAVTALVSPQAADIERMGFAVLGVVIKAIDDAGANGYTSGNGQWFTVMNAAVKTSTNKTLFASPSLVTGLYTNTQVKGSNTTATSQTATAVASVAVRVLLDCSNCAVPGQMQTGAANFAMAASPDSAGSGVVFDARIQQLTATLGQAITTGCLTFTTTLSNTCTPEVIDLILATTSAHSFNFILSEVGAGQHVVTVQARLDAGDVCYNNSGAIVTCTTSSVVNTSLASSVSAAVFGLGSLIVMPVQLAPGFTF